MPPEYDGKSGLYNLLPFLTDPATPDAAPDTAADATWPRREFFYWNDDGQLVAMRHDRWKLVFMGNSAPRSSAFG